MSWDRFQKFYLPFENLGVAVDVSRVSFPDDFLDKMRPKMTAAMDAMDALEKGAIANPDENRMVGHYWLRDPGLAPDAATGQEVESTIQHIESFAAKIHSGAIKGAQGTFKNILCIGIGGSALGPEFVAHALSQPGQDKLAVYFIDNTDPDGIDLVFRQLEGQLGRTLTIVTSKSGGTPEPRNGMVEAEAAYKRAGLTFGSHAVVTTGIGSHLDKHAIENQFLDRFPMWDWVGGRTSELGPVGLLPAALQGIDIRALLAGAKAIDAVTRVRPLEKNPAALMALSWYFLTEGRGAKDMVILPYKDRLLLLSRYLQQLVMESLGKEFDLQGKTVHQGISVYGNKGSTDQHAYVQQLRDGVPNFYAVFIEVLKDRSGPVVNIEPDTTAGDYLQGFLLGTRDALFEKGRQSITITLAEVSAVSIGQVIALFERAVGYYGSLVNINAYHQPGVEAGKKAAAGMLVTKQKVLTALRAAPGQSFTAPQLAAKLGLEPQVELIFKLLEHMAANPEKGVRKTAASSISGYAYSFKTG
jgi:glucose-6-phosphate isomerase